MVWNREPRVVKHSTRPRRGCVASRAGRGESRRHVIGIGRSRIVRLVAGIAVSGRSRKNIVDVATRASHRNVRSGQRERRVVVVECRTRPACRGVAHGTVSGETGRHVGRIRGAGKVGLMATVAGRVGTRQAVIVVHMALLARQCRVCAR